MSRTYKDRPYKVRQTEPWDKDRVMVRYEVIRTNYFTKELEEFITARFLENKTTKTKKRKVLDTEDHWMTTPGWWNRMCVTRPERKRVNAALQSLQCDLEDVDIPDLGRKPHIYYW